jgi:hypothetical protein
LDSLNQRYTVGDFAYCTSYKTLVLITDFKKVLTEVTIYYNRVYTYNIREKYLIKVSEEEIQRQGTFIKEYNELRGHIPKTTNT